MRVAHAVHHSAWDSPQQAVSRLSLTEGRPVAAPTGGQKRASKQEAAPKASAPSLPKLPSLPKVEDLPKPEPQKATKQAASAVKEAVPEAPQQAAKDAASAIKSVIPDQPKQAAQDAATTAKESLPEAPKTTFFQNIFSGERFIPMVLFPCMSAPENSMQEETGSRRVKRCRGALQLSAVYPAA